MPEMNISMYQASVPVFMRMLGNLAGVLQRAETQAEEKKFDPAVLIGARLYPDMFPLSRQIQIASDTAKGAASRLAGLEPPKYEDNEASFAELQARIAKTIAYLQTLSAEQFDGSELRDIVLISHGKELHYAGLDYLLNTALPSFYFHVTTAYAILRHNGIDIGKKDYLGTRQG
jgi:hypothetical protein